jgi:hypothetical protein
MDKYIQEPNYGCAEYLMAYLDKTINQELKPELIRLVMKHNAMNIMIITLKLLHV